MDPLAPYIDASTESPRFLNFASVGPLTTRARARLQEHVDVLTLGDQPPVEAILELWMDAKRLGGELLGTDADHVTFVASTSHGLFTTAFGLEPGGNVVVPGNEFPANIYPWLRAAELGRIELRLAPITDGRVTPDALRPFVDADTRAIAISAVGYSTGYRADLAAFSELAGDALLIVDAVQALGAVRVDLEGSDMVVAGSQKWMRSGIGSALAAVSDRYLERFIPTLTGWIGVDDMFGAAPAPHAPLASAERLAMGSSPLMAAGTWRGSLELTLEVGIDTIESALMDRSTAFEKSVSMPGVELVQPGRRPGERSAIVSFRTPGIDHWALVDHLKAEGFVVTCRDGTDVIRMSPHASTPIDTADEIGSAIAEFLGA